MKKLKVFYLVLFVLMFGLLYVMNSQFSITWTRISASLFLLIIVLSILLPRLWLRNRKKFEIVENRQQGDRIVRINGLNSEQQKKFLEMHLSFYNDAENGFGHQEWKPEVKIVDGTIYFLYPETVGFSDFCDDLYPYILSGNAKMQNEDVELTGWYPMTDGHSEKQDVPFKNKTLMLFRTDYQKHKDFVYFATEYSHVYKMELGVERLTEVKDVKVNYEPMPDWNTLVPDI